MVFLQYLIPQHFVSNLMHKFAAIKTKWIKNFCIKIFIRIYKIDLNLAKIKNINEYKSFNEFFTRELKENARIIATANLIYPVDGQVAQFGTISNNKLIQAKNINYSLENLLASNKHANNFIDGDFATIYLSPKDYHRIHMPFSAKLIAMDYVPGSLFAVNFQTVSKVKGLFTKNERAICYFDTDDFGICALILVGAIFVGSIETTWQGKITPPYRKNIKKFDYSNDSIYLKKGEELGRFNMGSTVILLLPKNNNILDGVKNNAIVKMGQKI